MSICPKCGHSFDDTPIYESLKPNTLLAYFCNHPVCCPSYPNCDHVKFNNVYDLMKAMGFLNFPKDDK